MAVEDSVGSGRIDGKYRIVSLTDKTCSCGTWQSRGWACIHGVAAFRKFNLGREEALELTTLASQRHLASTCATFYKCALDIPVVDTTHPLLQSTLTYPVALPAPAGRPRLQRRIQKGKMSRCSRCCQTGHNARYLSPYFFVLLISFIVTISKLTKIISCCYIINIYISGLAKHQSEALLNHKRSNY